MNGINDNIKKVHEYTNTTQSILQTEIIPKYEPAVLKGYAKSWPIVQHALNSDFDVYHYVFSLCESAENIVSFIAENNVGKRFFYNDDMTGFNFNRINAPLQKVIEHIIAVSSMDNPPANMLVQ